MIFIGAIVPQDVGVHDARTYRHVLVKLICRTGKRVRERGNGFGNIVLIRKSRISPFVIQGKLTTVPPLRLICSVLASGLNVLPAQ